MTHVPSAEHDNAFKVMCAVCCAFTFIHVALYTKRPRLHLLVRFCIKGGASSAFLAAALVMLLPDPPQHFSLALLQDTIAVADPQRLALLSALTLSAVGDLLLVWKNNIGFLFGLLAFFAAHVCYIVAFYFTGIDINRLNSSAWPVMVACLAIAIWLLPSVRGKERGLFVPVVAYLGVITVMVWTAFATEHADFYVCAVLFFVSDLGVAREKFIKKAFVNDASVILYYAAQLIFAYSLCGFNMIFRSLHDLPTPEELAAQAARVNAHMAAQP